MVSNENSKQKIIFRYILLNIFSEKWKYDTKLKSKGWFAYKFNVSTTTIKKIFSKLVLNQIVRRDKNSYYINRITKTFLADTNIMNLNEEFSYDFKKGKNKKWEVVYKEHYSELNKIMKKSSNLSIEYSNIIKVIKNSNNEIVRYSDFYYPSNLSLFENKIKGSFIVFLACNGFVCSNKYEFLDIYHHDKIPGNTCVRIFEILTDEAISNKIIKIGYHYINLNYFGRNNKFNIKSPY